MTISVDIHSLIEKIEIKVCPASKEGQETTFEYNKEELVSSIKSSVLEGIREAIAEAR